MKLKTDNSAWNVEHVGIGELTYRRSLILVYFLMEMWGKWDEDLLS